MKASLSAITEKIGAVFDIRKGEYIKTFSLFLYLLLVITCYVVSKTVRDALFLTKFGALNLPYVYIGIAIIASIFVAVYIKISRRVKQHVLLSLTLLFFASNVILFWWLSKFHFEWLFPVIYIWAGVFGVIAPMQVWTLSNYIMTTREAKRLYGFIGSGGVLGAIAGGFFSSWMVPLIGTENLLLSMAFFMLVCVFLVNLIWYKSAKSTIEINNRNFQIKDEQKESPNGLMQSLSLIRRSRYLILIAAIISVSSIATTIIDYQFKAVAQDSLSSKDELTAFFGNFYGYVGIAAFLIQISLTSKIMRKLGIGFTIFLLPIGLVLGSATLLIYMTLWSAVALRVPDQLFKHSIDKSTIELLYLPLPIRIKGAVKSFIDTVIWRIADGTAGLILLLLTSALSFSIREITIVNLVIISLWIAIAYAAKKEYVEALRSSIANPQNIEALLTEEKEETAGESYTSFQLLALDGGEHENNQDIESLLEHESPVVRARAINQLNNRGNERLAEKIKEFLDDDSIRVQLEAIRFICKYGGKDRSEFLDSLLKSPSQRVRGAAICFITNRPTDEKLSAAAQKSFESMVKSDEAEARREAARALGAINGQSTLHNSLFELLNDPSLDVVQEALISAGETLRLEFAPFIILKLESRSTRSVAAEALVKYGPKILGTLRDYLLDEDADIDIRRTIPQIISMIGSEEAVDILTNSLHRQNPNLQLRVIKALNRIRVQSPTNSEIDSEWNSQTAKIEEQLLSDVKEYYETLMLLHVYNPEYQWSFSRQRKDLVLCCLEEKLEILLERIFRLLGLIYPPKDLYHAYHGLSSENAIIRANSLELLDNLLESDHKNLILPLIDDEINRNNLLEVSESLGISICENRVEVLKHLLESNEPLILLCAIEAVHNQQIEDLYPLLKKAARHPEIIVRETAERVMELIDARTQTAAGQNNVLDMNKSRERIKSGDLTGLEKIKYLQKSILFANCRLDQLLEIAAISRKVLFKKGEVIFQKNDPGDSLYCIVEGKVQLNKEGTTFKTIIGKRESFGTLAILDRKPRTATAIAESDVIALKISSDDFYNLLADRIKIVQRIFSRLTQEIRTHMETGELGLKKRGRNRFQIFSSSTQKRASNE